MLQNKYDVVVVGGGPAGSMAAWEAAKGGVSVCMLEKDRDIGYPVRCGEAAGESGLRQFVEIEDSWIAEKITSVKLVSPNLTSVDIDFAAETGYILNRRIFDYDLSRYAANAGAEVYTKAYVKNVLANNGEVNGVVLDYLGEEKQIQAKIVIGADGLTSRVGRWAGLKTLVRMKDMESAVQYSVANVDIEPNKMIMYVGMNHAPGGYIWVFPKGKKFANIGIGISGKYSKHKSAQKYLDEFMEREYPDAAILTTMCGGVPCAKPMEKPVADGIMLVGDAAHQINPMTGGGIVAGMKGGWIAGQVAAEAIKKNDYSEDSLLEYPKRMRKDFGKNHERFYKIKEVTEKLTNEELDSIAEKVLSIPHNKRTLTSVFKAAVFKKPTLIIDVLKVFSGV
ncbi:MAG: NAD(P)/FAD-dependent oxidoreductase [Candidatus Marinimicrobia bacterium]|jgi:digeranylgeranylglycerophospholipid reductase|nr:NAD(P)/FAD-dependent oxidoreductase [Candidatus Neomarinimicrobiota bacterium]HIB14749.1 NAD(P)/FAD-dependent oxidoreductase [Candidatus Neomarinimicrobiota bacterium]HIG51503.1 NAD(P)/FAD-dependent oxidoreductase [Candidatus Neomarinimicrobiota bacterium]|tara:strand:- start:944 stop:2125 length:1182 start_codon:yes stop_codon:yes gene_type:complete